MRLEWDFVITFITVAGIVSLATITVIRIDADTTLHKACIETHGLWTGATCAFPPEGAK